jgi:hypothetical protein
MGINRDMSMPYAAIGKINPNKTKNTLPANFHKIFEKLKADRLTEIDNNIRELTYNNGRYNRSDSYELYKLFNERAKLLGQHTEFGGV